MRIFQLYFFIFFILLFTTCKKENTTIHGNVWDIAFGKPVVGGNINLVERKSTLSFESAGDLKILAVSTTDNNGNFEFFFHSKAKFRSGYSYYVEFDYDDKMYGGSDIGNLHIIDRVAIDKKEDNSVTLAIAPAADLKIIAHNITPYNSTDNITVYIKNNYYERSIFTYTGDIGSSNSYYYDYLAGISILRWEVTKNNVITIFSDTILLNHNEKRDYTINY